MYCTGTLKGFSSLARYREDLYDVGTEVEVVLNLTFLHFAIFGRSVTREGDLFFRGGKCGKLLTYAELFL